MELETVTATATVTKRATDSLTLSAGQRLDLTSFIPHQNVVFTETVPTDKAWEVTVNITVKETDG